MPARTVEPESIISGVSIGISTFMIWRWVKDITPVVEESEEASYQTAQEAESVFCILKRNPLVFLFLTGTALYSAAYMQHSFLMPLDMAARKAARQIQNTLLLSFCFQLTWYSSLPICLSRFRSQSSRYIALEVYMSSTLDASSRIPSSYRRVPH